MYRKTEVVLVPRLTASGEVVTRQIQRARSWPQWHAGSGKAGQMPLRREETHFGAVV